MEQFESNRDSRLLPWPVVRKDGEDTAVERADDLQRGYLAGRESGGLPGRGWIEE
jgi:hypothetical protein